MNAAPCMTLTDELRDKARKLSDSSNFVHDTVSSLTGMLYFIDRVVGNFPVIDLEFKNALQNALQGCRMLATVAVEKDGSDTILFLRDIASGRVDSSDQ